MTLSGRDGIWGPSKDPQSASQCTVILYIFCEVKFKFKCLQLIQVNLGIIHFMPNGAVSGSVDIYG